MIYKQNHTTNACIQTCKRGFSNEVIEVESWFGWGSLGKCREYGEKVNVPEDVS